MLSSECISALEAIGFGIRARTTRHVYLKHTDGRSVLLPTDRELSAREVRLLLLAAGIGPDIFVKALSETG